MSDRSHSSSTRIPADRQTDLEHGLGRLQEAPSLRFDAGRSQGFLAGGDRTRGALRLPGSECQRRTTRVARGTLPGEALARSKSPRAWARRPCTCCRAANRSRSNKHELQERECGARRSSQGRYGRTVATCLDIGTAGFATQPTTRRILASSVASADLRSEEHTSELQSRENL